MNEFDRIRLRHMLDASTEALTFVEGRAKYDVLSDRLLLLALIKEIEIVGEAASKISTEFRALHAEVPWASMIGMRNRLIHAYADSDVEVVWSAVTLESPTLVRICGRPSGRVMRPVGRPTFGPRRFVQAQRLERTQNSIFVGSRRVGS